MGEVKYLTLSLAIVASPSCPFNKEQLQLLRICQALQINESIVLLLFKDGLLNWQFTTKIPKLWWQKALVRVVGSSIPCSPEQVLSARALMIHVSPDMDPGRKVVPMVQPDVRSNCPKKRTDRERTKEAYRALVLVERMGASSTVYQRVHDMSWSVSDAIDQVTYGKLDPQHMRSRINKLLSYEEFCKKQNLDAWGAHDGSGPPHSSVEGFARNEFKRISEKNSTKDDDAKTGAGVLGYLKGTFAWAKKYLCLKVDVEQFPLVGALASKSRFLFGQPTRHTKPFSDNTLMVFEAVVCGYENAASDVDRYFCGAILTQVWIAGRFRHLQRMSVLQLKLICRGEQGTAWADKVYPDLPRFKSIDDGTFLMYQWLPVFRDMIPSLEHDRKFVVPSPTPCYQTWSDTGGELPTEAARKWLSRVANFPISATNLSCEERKQMAHVHSGRATLPTMVANLGGTVDDVMTITGHLDYKSALGYVKRAGVVRKRLVNATVVSKRNELGIPNYHEVSNSGSNQPENVVPGFDKLAFPQGRVTSSGVVSESIVYTDLLAKNRRKPISKISIAKIVEPKITSCSNKRGFPIHKTPPKKKARKAYKPSNNKAKRGRVAPITPVFDEDVVTTTATGGSAVVTTQSTPSNEGPCESDMDSNESSFDFSLVPPAAPLHPSCVETASEMSDCPQSARKITSSKKMVLRFEKTRHSSNDIINTMMSKANTDDLFDIRIKDMPKTFKPIEHVLVPNFDPLPF